MIPGRDLPTSVCVGCATPLLTLHVVADLVLLGSLLFIVAIRVRPTWRERKRSPFAVIVTTIGVLATAFALTLRDVVTLWDPSFLLATVMTLVATAVALGTTIALAFSIPRLGGLLRAYLSMSSYNEGRFLAAANSSHDGFVILESVRGPHGEIVGARVAFANANAASLLSRTEGAARGTTLEALAPADRAATLLDQFRHVVDTGDDLIDDIAVAVPGVDATWLRYKAVRLHDGVAITTTDISGIKERERELASLAEFKVSIIASSPFATIVTDVDGTITSFNPAAEKMLHYQRADLVNRASVLVMLDRGELATRALALSTELGTPVAPDIGVLSARPSVGLAEEAEWRLVRRDGSRVDVQLTVSTLTSADGPAGLIIIAYDVTERKRAADYISHIAHHDELTGLATRRLLRDRADTAIARARRQQDKLAVLTVDLDNFKRINDVQGHHVGDQVLQAVSSRLGSAVRASDSVARVGGDEFVVLVTDLASAAEADAIAEKLAVALAAPLTLDLGVPAPTASIGIAVYPDDGTTVDQLLKNADAAMYQAKADGKHGHQRFTDALASVAVRRRLLEAGLAQALAGDELALVYQPQIDMPTGMVTGVEALMRWRSAELGLVMPGEFIAIAEESGLIVPFGEWALRTACRDGQRLQRELGRPLTIAVNLSSQQLFQAHLPAIIGRILAATGLEPGTLELEITESTLVGDGTRSVRTLEEIRALGVRLSLDDFGTGFSSLSYIRRFHVDRLKIDRTFIRTIALEQESRAIVSAITSLAAGLQIAVIAEGVETAAQRDILIAEGCADAQGYFYARPTAADRLAALIRTVERKCGTPAVDRRRGAA